MDENYGLTVTINDDDIKAIEDKLPDLASWLTDNFESFGAQVVVLNSILEGLDTIKKEMENFNED